MTYQVSRNGQMYGPYTLEDLQRYVASGNVLPTDLAKSEDMPEWLPVAQILGTPGAPGTPTLAYAPPAAYPQPTGIGYPDPPNLHWGLELLLGFFTCGLFVIVWNIIIAVWSNRIQPASKALMFYIIATVLVVLNFGGSWGVIIAVAQHHPYPHHGLLGNLLGLASWIVRLIARFTLRDTIEQHYNGPEPLGIRLNPVMTFFFGGIYFQYKLNEINQIKQALRYQNIPR
jgi:GYF domain 2